jgi:hypothetical protein
VKQSRILAPLFAGVLVAAAVVPSQAQVVAGATVGWGLAGYGPFVPYLYGPYGYRWPGPCGPCNAGAFANDPYLRRAIRRELEQLEYLRELGERSQPCVQSNGRPLCGARGDWPPPTPEEQVQPAYRGSGEIRPEFSHAGQSRQAVGGSPRWSSR